MTDKELKGRTRACIQMNIKNLENLYKDIKDEEYLYFMAEHIDDLERSIPRLLEYIKELKKSLND